MQNCMENAKYLSNKLVNSDKFELLGTPELPIVTFKFKQTVSFTPFQLSQKLRERGWMLPAYTLPENASDITAMRVVVRETFSRDMAENLFKDIMNAYKLLEETESKQLKPEIPPHNRYHATC